MSNIFNSENKFFQGVNKVIDCIVVNALWTILCLPTLLILWMCFEAKSFLLLPLAILTCILAGPATIALYYASQKSIRRGRGYTYKEFFHSFKTNFKIGAIVGIIYALILTLLCADVYWMYQFAISDDASLAKFAGVAIWVFVVFIVLVLIWGTYLFSYIAKFENTVGNTLKNTIIIAVGNLPKSIAQFIFLLIPLGAVLFCILGFENGIGLALTVMVILPSLYMLLKGLLLEKTFRKYMSDEDLKAEDERNREYKN